MTKAEENCTFLNREGRCSIHPLRPGICRMFPLGRLYENGSFRYFLQIHECPKEDRRKIKVKKWLDLPEIGRYEGFVCDWHDYLKALRERVAGGAGQIREISLNLLNRFYVTPYESEEDFYEQFYRRM